MMPVMAGNHNREGHQDERRNQAASPVFVFVQRRMLKVFDTSLEPTQRFVILTRGIT
jgi:hypothetical protein